MLLYSLCLLFFLSNIKVKKVNGLNKSDSENKYLYMLSTFNQSIPEEIQQHLRQSPDLKSEIAELEKKLNETMKNIKTTEDILTVLKTNENETEKKLNELKTDLTKYKDFRLQEDILRGTRDAIKGHNETLIIENENKQKLEQQIKEKKKQLNPQSPDPSTSTAKSPQGQPDGPGNPKDEKPDQEGPTTPAPTNFWTKLLQNKKNCFSRVMQTFKDLLIAVSTPFQRAIEFIKQLFGSKT